MGLHSPSPATFRRPSPQVAQSTRIQAPYKGVDARFELSRGDPLHCIYTFNMMPNEHGMQIRNGYREWAIGFDNGIGDHIGTIIPFGGNDADGSDDRLFVVTNEGIWDATIFGAAPTLVLDFTDPGNGNDTGPDAGYGTYTHYTSDAGEEYLFYADEANGLFQYVESTDTWARKSDVNGPIAENIVFVTNHRKQLWFIERDVSHAWYLPAGSLAGDADQFFFGTKFTHGGNLAGLFAWTVDAGEGLDDYLVAIGRAGDVIPYKGTDPSSADNWNAVGSYFIGTVPKGGNFATRQGGRLYILCGFGLIDIEDLLVGSDGKNVQELTQVFQVTPFIRNDMAALRNFNGWQIRFAPSIGSYVINTPNRASLGVQALFLQRTNLISNSTYRQYVQHVTTGGWGFWRGVQMTAFDTWGDVIYFGDGDLRLLAMDVDLDDVLLTPVEEINGHPIDFSMLTNFMDFGQPTQFKRTKYVRADFAAQVAPNQTSRVLYDYNIGEIVNVDTQPGGSAALWDVDVWDIALWASSLPSGINDLEGGWGIGRNMAIAIRGEGLAGTALISWDVVWDAGSPI